MAPVNSNLTQSELKQLLTYNPDTGVFTWRESPNRSIPVGTQAGSKTKKGYVRICINGSYYMAHSLAFLYMTGKVELVDHINNHRDDNRWSNLRPASLSQNACNAIIRNDNTTGVKGISLVKGQYRARLTKDKITYNIGYFDSLEEAKEVLEAKRKELHGNFANNG